MGHISRSKRAVRQCASPLRATKEGGKAPSRPIIVWDVMSTLVYDPFFVEVPKFLGMKSVNELYPIKDGEAWLAFERGEICEGELLRDFFLDRREWDGKGMVQMLGEEYRWLPGVEDMVRSLSEQGYEMHILSNYPVWWSTIEEKLRLSRYMQWSFVSCQEGMRKPDARIYQLVADRLAVPPSSIIFVDDSPSNVDAAVAMGWKGCVFEGVERLQSDLLECGVQV
eukprot:CAMPEP_0173401784 /NCGR_PEP_ID=MMETSP1356-20130122/52004_1 /TAXON_ID=77927 ORGANISM="Hemiselmis virescens, Strain PCC157" /NCGR_SAMPLE_ID=MMETSP1356 /ASSEMBLY_ACC=CAM_ASM_000847 /LENGTH=224 /DNA_ID=CAMNT_0014362011 /DNA_START=137 /DNA_END=811 /DNA_ORIENTATION=-